MCPDGVLRHALRCLYVSRCRKSFIIHVTQTIFISTIKFLCSRLKQVRRLSDSHSVAQQAISCHRLICSVSFSLIDTMAAQAQTASAWSYQASMTKLQDLHSRADVPLIRNAGSDQEARQLKEKFNAITRAVLDSGYQDGDSLMTVVLKRSLRNSGEMSWDNHHHDVIRFLKSYHQLHGEMSIFVISGWRGRIWLFQTQKSHA